MNRLAIALLLALPLLGGCELFGESVESIVARREAEGKAVGAACRHAARAIEDCFALNRKVDKAAIFAGWREMNDYMRENKIDPVAPATTEVAQTRGADVPPEPRGDAAADPAREAKQPSKTTAGRAKQAS